MAEILTSLVKPAMEELGRVTVATIKRQFNYLCCLKSNIQSLTDEAGKLEDARSGLQMQVEAAENKGEVIVAAVKTWLENASNKKVDKRGIDDEIPTVKNGCLSIKSRFLLSRKVKQTADAMKDLRERCNDFKKISEPAPPASKAAIPQGTSCEFESRKQIENEIMEDLRGRKVNMMGICGMGGVGKTTMAERIMERVREEKLFDEVVMAVVSQPVDELKIQGEIAELLGMVLKEESLSARAYKLYARLNGANRFLLILDDVWERLKLKELGIPGESDRGCTIILTSRSRDVLREMKAQLYEMKILSETEAWFLFREKVGTWIDDSDLLSIAKEVVEECKGLPLALTTVGITLENEKSKNIWKDALQQLKSSNPIDMPHVLAEVYKPIKLSYDFLDNHHARSLFLLCCLYPEDYNIRLKYLTMYGIGFHMFEGMSLEEARNRVCTLCKMLKGRFLLLDGRDENHVKMHDVVRDVAIYIASKDGLIDQNLSLKHSSREESVNCTWISVIGEQIKKLPIDLSFPSLRLLSMANSPEVPEIFIPSFFQGMKELNVLSFSHIYCRSLPETTQLLTNLRTLYLNWCSSLKTISIVGQLLSLEILICRSCNNIVELPVEIGRLERLKLLEVSYCSSLKRIVPGVISKLVQLEELMIVGSFLGWERKSNGEQRDNATLCELEHLKNLTRLDIEIGDANLAAEEICFSSKIVKYRIRLSREIEDLFHHERVMCLVLEKDITLAKWIHVFLRSTHFLSTKGDGSNSLDLAQAQNLKKLVYKNCSTMNKLVNITKASNSFENLKELSLFNCPKLSKLFPMSMAKDGLLLLEKLEIKNCKMMEEVFANEENEKDGDQCHMITFTKLKSLMLSDLPRLTTFCKGSESIKFPLLNAISIKGCGNLKSLISGSCDNLNLEGHDADSFHLFCTQKVSFGSLMEVKIEGLDTRKLFSSAIIKDSLLQLEKLHITNCEMMEEVFVNEENEKDGDQSHMITFPKLKTLYLERLPRLTSNFCKGSENIEFPLLEKFVINNCEKLTSLISSTCDSLNLEGHDSFHLFCNQKVSFGCLKEIFFESYGLSNMWCHQIPVGFFSQLVILRIRSSNVIRSLFSSSIAKNLVNLKELDISSCNEMVKVIEDIDEEMLAADQNPYCILFPSLKGLVLHKLPKLQSFCNWRCDLQLPSLERVWIDHCPLLKLESVIMDCGGKSSLFSSSTAKNLVNLKELEIYDCNEIVKVIEDIDEEMLAADQKPHCILFPSLKKLRLQNLPKLQSFCNWRCDLMLPSLEYVEIDRCALFKLESVIHGDLKKIHIYDSDEISSLFSSSIAKKLVNLEELSIGRCPHCILFPSLKDLHFYDLPKLQSFCNWRYDLQLPSLERVWIDHCPLLELESVIFGNLKEIDIEDCDGISSLFSSSIAKKLVNLEELIIGGCNEMVKVIEDIDEEMLAADQNPHCILFPSLKELNLCNLPKLQSFCNWRCDLQLPSLERVKINRYPFLELFTPGSVSTPNSEFKDVGDLNSAIQQLHFETNQHQPISTPKETSTSDDKQAGAEEDHQKSEIQEAEQINEEFTSAQMKE